MLLYCSVVIAIFINIVLPQSVMPFASNDEITPPNGAENLSFKEQLIHMLVHHGQVPISSSIIVAIIVILSIILGKKFCKLIKINKK
tara:strand:+ start:63 stop:323 length:261 start_codon:yes stop_codon:yes gene_type:complete